MWQETRLKENCTLKIPGMKTIRDDRGVGTLIAIKRGIKTTRVNLNLNTINYAAMEITCGGRKILLASIYLPCAPRLIDIDNDLNKLLDMQYQYDGCICGGDWNARHSSWNVDPNDTENGNGHKLRRHLIRRQDWKLTNSGKHTFRAVSNIDFFITYGIDGYARRGGTAECHSPVVLNTRLSLSQTTREKIQTRISYAGTNWETARTEWTLALNWINIPKNRTWTKEEIERVIEEVSERIMEVR